jgi:putative transcriptional regulator
MINNKRLLQREGIMGPTNDFLTNHFLIAMPGVTDTYFSRSVVYICEHSNRGAVGIIVNQPLQTLRSNLSEILKIFIEGMTDINELYDDYPVLCGGPIHPERGFVLHRPGTEWQSSFKLSNEICITASNDILQAIARQKGPEKFIFSLGYASWVPGQIEKEIINNAWLTVPATPSILFDVPLHERWQMAMQSLGVDIQKLVYRGGCA